MTSERPDLRLHEEGDSGEQTVRLESPPEDVEGMTQESVLATGSAQAIEELVQDRPLELFAGRAPLTGTEVAAGANDGNASAILSAPEGQVPARHFATRSPNIVDAFLFGVLMVLGLLITTGFLGVSLYFHWFGLHNFSEAQNDTRLALGTQLLIYLVGLTGAVPLFQMVWGKGFLDGIHWHAATALRRKGWLILTAFGCNLIAVAGNYLLPFPQHAPIDKLFGSSADAWMLFLFGVTIAPFFEEMMFRGFLLPAMATAWDWSAEKMTHRESRGLDAEGNPLWSMAAMVFAALVVSAPFAGMHAAQVGNSWGPVSLLYCVSLILCAVRLKTKSLAASTLVHSAYNFMLFSVMLVETGGFRHLEKM